MNLDASQLNRLGTDAGLDSSAIVAAFNLIEHVNAALVFVDPTWRIAYINPEAEALTGRSRQEIIGKNFWQCFPDLARSHMGNFYQQAMESHLPVKIEEFYEPSQQWFELNITPTGQGLAVFLRDISMRKKFEEELKENEEWLGFLSNAATEGILVREGDLIVDANQAAAEMCGYSLEELVGIPVSKVVTPETLEQIEQRVQNLRVDAEWTRQNNPNKYDGPYEGVLLRKDGTTFPFESLGRFMEYKGRRIRVMVLRDLKERLAAEEALKESEERFRTLEEASFEGILIHDGGEIVDANQTLADLFGYSLQEILGMSFLHLIAPESRALVARRISEGFTGYYEAKGLRKDGSTFPLETQGRFIRYKGKQLRVKAIRDITERYRYETQLKENEERWEFLSNATSEGIIIFRDGKVMDANMAAVSLFGYTLEEFRGMDVSRLVTPEALEAGLQRIANGENENKGTESLIIHKDGELIPVEGRSRLAEYKGQSVSVAAFHDLREQKAAEALLKKTQAQLQQAQRMESIGLLAGGIAHDFNNLLTTIIGYSELAAFNTQPDDPISEDLEQILNAAQRASSLTRQLLAFSRQQILQPKLINLNERVAVLDKLLQRLIGEDIELVSLPDQDLGLALIDPTQFEQVIMNLAVNARDAMPGGGKLTIETANIELDGSYHSQHYGNIKPGHYVMLAVSDNGTGMDEEILAKIFDPFFTTKEVGKGTGLGLATVYGIVNQSGGSIFVYSEPGVGTTFKVYLPRQFSDVDSNQLLIPGDTPVKNLEGSETILVIEDDDAVRNLILLSLKSYGYNLLEASNGEKALELLDEYRGPIDLILTDIVMPRMGGQELASQLIQKGSNIKLICMSGYTDRVVSSHNILPFCQNFLQKPFSPTGLVSKIREVLDQQ